MRRIRQPFVTFSTRTTTSLPGGMPLPEVEDLWPRSKPSLATP